MRGNAKRLKEAEKLLDRIVECIGDNGSILSNDPHWFHDLYLFTGDHMICTEEGWEPGKGKRERVAEYGEDYILAEVNAPKPRSKRRKKVSSP